MPSPTLPGQTLRAFPLRLACAGGVAAAVGLGSLAGCGIVPKFQNLAEQRAVRRFGEALADEDLAALAEATTADFSGSALTHEEALDDLRLLRLPTGEIEVVAVTEIPEGEWDDPAKPESLVIVKTPAPVRQARFKLVRAEPGRWLVDDVQSKQKLRGVKATLNVSDQLELLASARNFASTWVSGSREEKLALVTPELRADLASLPPARLDELAGWVVNADRVGALRPTAQMEEENAAVRFTGRGYTLELSLARGGTGDAARWLVKDASATNPDGGPAVPSLERACVAMRGVGTFLDAYAAGDKQTLETVTVPRLYTGSLADADLATVPLPTAADLGAGSTFRIDGDTAEVVFTRPPTAAGAAAGAVTVVLTDPHRNDPERRTGTFLVSEVTVRGGDGGPRLLSSIFTARAAVRQFADAARVGDLAGLKMASTRDFAERVWGAAEVADLAGLPLADAGHHGPALAERYAKPVTEITLDTPAGPRTFVLRDEGGAAKVDDVLVPAFDRPESLKQVCELILPVRAYARTLAAGDRRGLTRRSSTSFNRLVWHQTQTVPEAARAAAPLLTGPLAAAGDLPRGELATCELRFGTEREGAVVALVRQNGVLAVDDVTLIAGPGDDQRVAMKAALRSQMAAGTLRLAKTLLPSGPRRDAAVTPAAFVPPAAPAGEPAPAVVRASYEVPAGPSADPGNVPPPFGHAFFPEPAAAGPPVPGCDDGACAPFDAALPLGG